MRHAVPLILALLGLAWAASARAADDAVAVADAPATEEAAVSISAADAADHVGEECTVELTVRAARSLADKDMCFLNSSRNRRDDGNFTVVIFKAGLARFKDAGIENPALHFLDRTIRVRGTVAEFKGSAQIVVDDPAQIELVEADVEAAATE